MGCDSRPEEFHINTIDDPRKLQAGMSGSCVVTSSGVIGDRPSCEGEHGNSSPPMLLDFAATLSR